MQLTRIFAALPLSVRKSRAGFWRVLGTEVRGPTACPGESCPNCPNLGPRPPGVVEGGARRLSVSWHALRAAPGAGGQPRRGSSGATRRFIWVSKGRPLRPSAPWDLSPRAQALAKGRFGPFRARARILLTRLLTRTVATGSP